MAKKSARRVFREGVEDFTNTPQRLSKLIDQGRCSAVVNFHLITDDDGKDRIAMIAGGMSPHDIFDAICVVRRSMMLMSGMVEAGPRQDVSNDGLVADDEPQVAPLEDMVRTLFPPPGKEGHEGGMPADPPRAPERCKGCGRDYWAVMARCEHAGCPNGLYVP